MRQTLSIDLRTIIFEIPDIIVIQSIKSERVLICVEVKKPEMSNKNLEQQWKQWDSWHRLKCVKYRLQRIIYSNKTSFYIIKVCLNAIFSNSCLKTKHLYLKFVIIVEGGFDYITYNLQVIE
ncbi:Hypothetical_protein [Hexamita inflata]|uniref:Hypothetical_protein n=1 Tax=Hexamita inflata TaxID=28002 RepID=A0AA86NJF1_9EUKA|nr:Hypothetical protein HINF_LOCUS7834 [Hexamita inflata]